MRRVVSVNGNQVTIAYPDHVVMDAVVKKETMPIERVIPQNGSLSFGALVAYKGADSWEHGILVYQDGKNAWLTRNVKVPLKSVRAMDVAKPRKVGDVVVASTSEYGHELGPRKITKVIDDGLRFEVKREGGDSGLVVTLCEVISSVE